MSFWQEIEQICDKEERNFSQLARHAIRKYVDTRTKALLKKSLRNPIKNDNSRRD
jgi:hypothetical protein